MTDLEALARGLSAAEEAIADLREKAAKVEECLTERSSGQLLEHATLYALQQVVQEACAQLGVSEAQYASRFQEVARWHYDILARTASDSAKSFVARIDVRSPDEVPTDEHCPRMFREDEP